MFLRNRWFAIPNEQPLQVADRHSTGFYLFQHLRDFIRDRWGRIEQVWSFNDPPW